MKLKIVKKINPRDLEDSKFYLSPIHVGTLDLKELAEIISDASTVNVADVAAVLKSLSRQLPLFLQKGFVIELGDFGRFRMSISTDGKKNREDLSANDVSKVRILFVPNIDIKKKIAGTSFTVENSNKEKS